MTTRATFGEGLEALRAAQKPSRGTAAYSRHVNRPAGRYVAAAANTRGMTPNQVSVVSALFSFSGIALLAIVRPSVGLGILVALLLAVGYVLDSVDGQLARLSGGGSVSGEWLDHTIDTVKTTTLHLAVLVSWYRFDWTEGDAWLLVPLGFTVVAVVTYFGILIMPTLRPRQPAAQPGTEHPLRQFLLLPQDYGFQCWMFVLLGWTQVFAAVYTTVFACCAALLAVALRKWWRELRAIDAGGPA